MYIVKILVIEDFDIVENSVNLFIRKAGANKLYKKAVSNSRKDRKRVMAKTGDNIVIDKDTNEKFEMWKEYASMEYATYISLEKIETTDEPTAQDYADYALEDDSTEFGGISFSGETLRDYMGGVGRPMTTPMSEVNKSLKANGILPIKVKK